MGFCSSSSFSSLPLSFFLFISIFTFLFNSQLKCVAWDPKCSNAESIDREGIEANVIGGGTTDLGFTDNVQERDVRKVSGEDNVGDDMKVLILDNLRILFGLHSSTSVRHRSSGTAHTRYAFSPAPAPIEEAVAPVPAPAKHFHHAHLYHHSSLPHSTYTPPPQDGHALRSNDPRTRVGRIVIAIVVSIGVIILIVGFTVALLCHRSRRKQKKRLEEMMLVTGVGGGFGGSKVPNITTAHQKVSPSPTQELFYLGSLEPIQEEHEPIRRPASGPETKRSSPANCRQAADCECDSASCSAEEILQNRDSPSFDDDDDDESFHSICNSDGSSTPCSNNTSEARHSLQSEDHSPSFSKQTSSPAFSLKAAPTQLSPARSLITPATPESIPSIPLDSQASPSRSSCAFIRRATSAPHSSSRTENSEKAEATMLSFNLQMTSLLPETSTQTTISSTSNTVHVARGNLMASDKPSSPANSYSVQKFSSASVPKLPQLNFQQGTNSRKDRQPPSLPPTLPPQPKLGSNPSKSPPPPPLPPIKPLSFKRETNFGQQPPPPPPCKLQPPVPVGKDGSPLPKLKPLHWDKVGAATDRSMVWDKIRTNSFELNEEMIESLFSYNLQTNEAKSKASSPSKHVLEPKRLQNFTILLKALNATTEQVCYSLMQGSGLCAQQLEVLMKMAPTKEEAANLSKYEGDINELGAAERFVKAVSSVPYSFQKIEVMLYIQTFEDEVALLRNSFQMLQEACEELRSSRLFMRLLEAVLRTGNRMNVGTVRGGATAFKLDALLKLADVKGTDGKTTLLHFVVQEVVRSEGFSAFEMTTQKRNKNAENKSYEEKEEDYRNQGLELVSGLSNELCNVKKTAGIDMDVLATSVSNLSAGMEKLSHLIEDDLLKQDGSASFVHLMNSFRNQAEVVINELKDKENWVLLHVREITEYFHGDVGKDEVNPLRIFVIVRDFLGMLDRVCKELSRTQHSLNRVMSF